MTSLVIDTAELIAGALIIGGTSLGVLGADVPAGGTDGPSPLYNDITLPAEAADEFRFVVTASDLPAETLYIFDDASFTIIGAPDGAYALTYQAWKNGQSLGTSSITIYIGVPGEASFALAFDALTWSGRAVGADSRRAPPGYTITATARRLEIRAPARTLEIPR